MDRRTLLRLAGSTAALTMGLAGPGGARVPARGRDATDLATLGLPELTVRLDDDGYQVAPATTTAGWTLVTFENGQGGNNSADLIRLPPGETAERLLAAVAAPDAAPPAWIYETAMAGAPWAPAGGSAQAVVRLTEGDWAVLSPAPLAPASLTVAAGEGSPDTAPPVTADVDVTMREFTFVGLEEPVAAGRQLWKVTNAGRQPHLMTLGPIAGGTTQAQFTDELMAMMAAPPPADAPGPVDMLAGLPTANGCSALSAGQTLYLALDLAAGTHGAVCFFPDPETGAPHIMMGMVQVFSVG